MNEQEIVAAMLDWAREYANVQAKLAELREERTVLVFQGREAGLSIDRIARALGMASRRVSYALAGGESPVERVKQRARFAVRNALASGRLEREPCEECGSPIVQAHHEDYAKPLKVRWLCPLDHQRVHRGELELRPQRRRAAART